MKRKYEIGDWVSVSADVSYLFYDEQKQRRLKIIQHNPPYAAQIVGACRKMLGEYEEAGMARSYGFDLNFDPDYEPPYLKIESSQVFWLVRRGMLNKPIMVRDEDCELAEKPVKKLSWKWVNTTLWTQADKDEQRDIMSNACRDEKGRWMKL